MYNVTTNAATTATFRANTTTATTTTTTSSTITTNLIELQIFAHSNSAMTGKY
jgi:hypothetical protein